MRKPTFITAVCSIFIRLPLGFQIPIILFFFLWTFFISNFLMSGIEKTKPVGSVVILSNINDILIGFVIVAVYFIGLIVVYNLAVLANFAWSQYRKTQHAQLMRARVGDWLGRVGLPISVDETSDTRLPAQPYRPDPPTAAGDLFSDTNKIGIVLAGGGAKGAFQAGAMKAIYQFLVANNALHKVEVISGTSIGAWNALFWLADLIVSKDGEEQSLHERWWRSISLKSLLRPSWYVPGWRNCFFHTDPWQHSFDDIFGRDPIRERIKNTDIRFYFTYSHVNTGDLHCVTNNVNNDAYRWPKENEKRIKFERISPSSPNFFERLKFGVFASMDLPPLFPYERDKIDCFEDGGVVDNLPILFANMDSCDLIFVLALNSDFQEKPDQRSLLYRLIRVMDVRQGALERTSLKILYLYNELAVLREYVDDIKRRITAAPNPIALPPIASTQTTLSYSLGRGHSLSKIFAICPDRRFVEDNINTHELWKAVEADAVFEKMHEYTHSILNDRERFNLTREEIVLWLVNQEGRWSEYTDIF
jgi:predicted acylesterase/phospholipase RssA